MSATNDPLLDLRKEFPSLDSCVYLNSNSQGAMPRGVAAKMQEYAADWAAHGSRAWEESWWMLPQAIADRLGDLIGAERGTVSIHSNVTLAHAVVLSCFEFWSHRNKVVYSELEFPSTMYLYEGLIARGARIVRVPSRDGVRAETADILSAIDGDTLLVPISHVLFKSGYVQDVAAIVEKAHKVGARVVLDCYQSAGTMPVDVARLGVDFAVGGTLKWLCGGPGVAYLYASPAMAKRASPILTGWMAHARPLEFELPPIDYRRDAYRFMNGTPAIPALYACQPGLEIVAQAGIPAIRAKSRGQTQRLIDAARGHGWKINSPADSAERGGVVALEVPGLDMAAVAKELARRKFVVDHRPGAGLRVAPHFYTTDAEIAAFVEELARIASGAASGAAPGAATTLVPAATPAS